MIDVVFNERLAAIAEVTGGRKIVLVGDTVFRGKKSVDWKRVEDMLKIFVGSSYTVASTGHVINIGRDMPDEYAGSRYTYHLRGAAAKAKANAAVAVPELIMAATGGSWRPNRPGRHDKKAPLGWLRYDSYLALPMFDSNGAMASWGVYHTSLVARKAEDGNIFLYDLIDIKRETSDPLELAR